jgi:hypothetical protein
MHPQETKSPQQASFIMAENESLDLGKAPRWQPVHRLLGTRVVADATALAPFIDLFRRYRREWLELAARGQSRQWLWADWLAPRKVAV